MNDYPKRTIVDFTTAQPGWQIVLCYDQGPGKVAKSYVEPLVGWATVEAIHVENEVPPFERRLYPVWLEEDCSPVWSGDQAYGATVVEVLAPGQAASYIAGTILHTARTGDSSTPMNPEIYEKG